MNKKQLSRPQQRIIEGCQDIAFGRVTFHVLGGIPDLMRPWRTRQTVKLSSAENGPQPCAARDDFSLCKEQTALLVALSQVRDGASVTVEVRHGLPFLVEIEQDHQAA